MPRTCNIDGRGRLARLIWGLTLLLTGLLLALFWALPGGGWLAWLLAILAAGAGILGLYEARTGWCAIRAMGIRTPM
jgi:hypothetical protein